MSAPAAAATPPGIGGPTTSPHDDPPPADVTGPRDPDRPDGPAGTASPRPVRGSEGRDVHPDEGPHGDRHGDRDDGRDDGRELDDVAREHLPGLLRYATTLTGDPHQAADIVQEVLVRAHSRWRRIGLLERPDLYLRRMVTNEHLSWRRRWHVRSVRPSTDEVLAARATPVADHAHRVADHDALHRALATLTPRRRTVLVLRYLEGLDDGEIATVLETSRATVRSHVSHALAALRAATGGQELL